MGSAIDDGSFDVGEWSNIIGNGLAQNIHAVLNDQNPVAADRWSAAEIDVADYLSNGVNELKNNTTLQDDILTRFDGITKHNTNLSTTSDGLSITGPNGVSLQLTANDLSGDLLSLINAYNSGSPISSVLSQSITGQINALTLEDGNSGTSVGLHFSNGDGNIQDAEELALDINGTSIVFSGSIPRDIGSIWSIVFEDTHLSIIDKIEAAGHKIDGFKVQSDGQTVASIGTDGIFIEARYQVPEEVTMGGSPRALQFHLDTQIEDLSAMTGTFSGVRISDVLLDPSGTVVEEEVALNWSTSEVSIAVADIELAVQGSFSNRLESIENLDTADVASASLSVGEQGARIPLVTASQVSGMPDTPF